VHHVRGEGAGGSLRTPKKESRGGGGPPLLVRGGMSGRKKEKRVKKTSKKKSSGTVIQHSAKKPETKATLERKAVLTRNRTTKQHLTN